MKKNEIERCLGLLEEWEYLDYGTVIPVTAFETLFDQDVNQSWEFLGPLLEIREALTEKGYLCTQRDIPFGCLKIYDVDEMIQASDRVFKNTAQRVKKLQKCMANAKVDQFSDKDFRSHMHMSNKITAGLNAMRSILNNL